MTGTNPWRYRVYVVQNAVDGKELRAEFVEGKRDQGEALRTRDKYERSMRHTPGVPDERGVLWSVVVRDEPLPEFP